MTLKPDECIGCPLYGDGKGFSRPEGAGRTGVLIVGDSLGIHEEEDGLPFRPRAQAGGVLERVIRRAGYTRDDFRIWNTIGCAPPGHVSIEGQPWQDEAVERCRTHFRRVVAEFQPKCILALGGVALKALTGFSGSKDMRVSSLRGFVLESEYCPVVPTFHPSYLRRGSSKSREKGTGAKTKGTTGPGMALLGVLIHDLQRAVAVAKHDATKRTCTACDNGFVTCANCGGSGYCEYCMEGQIHCPICAGLGITTERKWWITQPEFSGYLDGYNTQPTIEDAREFLDRAKVDESLMIGFDLEHPKKAEDPDEESDKEEMEWLTDGINNVSDVMRSDQSTNGVPITERSIVTGQEIYSAQFSLSKGTGIYFPWIGEFIGIAKELLALPNLKAGHYARVNDNPRLATWGINVREPFIDTWELFHHLQPDIPAPLQFVASFAGFPFPWKHWRQVHPEWYGIADVDALHYIVPWALRALEGLGLRGKFVVDADGHVSVTGYEQVRRLGAVFANMTRRGIPVNETERKKFRLELDAERARMKAEIQSLVPDSARPVRKIGKDAAKYYQRPPATVRLALIENPHVARVEGEDGVTYVREEVKAEITPLEESSLRNGGCRPDDRHAIGTDIRTAIETNVESDQGKDRTQTVAAVKTKPVQAALWEDVSATSKVGSPIGTSANGKFRVQVEPDTPQVDQGRWYALEPFNPLSPRQILAYCKAKGYEPPKDRHGFETTAAYVLERLGRKTKDKIFKLVLESREVVTMGGTFVDGWMPDADGRVHPRFYVAPGTGQHCVAAGTLIEIARDVRAHPKGVPIESVKAGDWAYCFDAHKNLALRRVLWAGKTGHRELVRVHWRGSGHQYEGFTDTTPEHLFRRVDGTYQEAKKLNPGERLLAMSRYGTRYSNLVATGHKEIRDHRFVFWQVNGWHPEHVHHKGIGNKLDNRPENLEGKKHGEHCADHSREMWRDPEKRKRLEAACKENYKTGLGKFVADGNLNGEKNPGWLGLKHDYIVSILREHEGKPSKAAKAYGIDYETFQKYMRREFVDWRTIRAEFTNHEVIRVEWITETADVYDLQIDDCECFIANEICVHNSSRGPNAQNSPVHTRLASAFQNIIEARPGYTLVKFDWKSFHSVMFAFEAQDPTLMRLSRMDPHSFVTAHMCKIPERDKLLAMPDDELRERLKWIRSCGNHLDPVTNECTRHSWAEKASGKCWQYVRDARAKPGWFGWLLGMRERTLWEQNRDAFDRIKDAKAVLSMLNRTFSKAREFQRQVQLVAHKRGRLVSRWGFVRWFWEVFKYDYATGENPPGDDSEAAIAFLIQNDAHGYRNAVMVEAEEKGFNERFGLINEVHDDLRFECADELVPECIASVKALMERPRPELTCPVTAPYGLSVACSVAVGRRLSELH